MPTLLQTLTHAQPPSLPRCGAVVCNASYKETCPSWRQRRKTKKAIKVSTTAKSRPDVERSSRRRKEEKKVTKAEDKGSTVRVAVKPTTNRRQLLSLTWRRERSCPPEHVARFGLCSSAPSTSSFSPTTPRATCARHCKANLSSLISYV